MKKLNNIISNSIFASIGTLLDKNSLSLFSAYFNFNKNFIEKFPLVIYAFNGDEETINVASDIIKQLNTETKISVTKNLGHTFGTFLLDNAIFQEASKHPYDYVWKFSNDVIIDNPILEYPIEDADFYYINNIGYISLDYENEPERPKYSKENLLQSALDQSYFYPQTNYYIIKNNISFYPDIETIYSLKKQYDIIKNHNPNIQPWHAIYECDSENMLKKTVINNNLKKFYLLDSVDTKLVIDYVYETKNYDGSHKNVLYTKLGNLCHLHYPQHPVYMI
jgi:hypothetical protein